MNFKLFSLYICILCLVSGLALDSSIQSKSPSFPNQFIKRCDIQFPENSKFQTSISENEAASILQENTPGETQSGFFGSIWSYAQQGLDSAKEKLKKVPNVLSRQASAIGNKAKNLPNVLSKEVSKAGKTINHLSRKVSDGISNLGSKPTAQTNITEPISKQVRDNETLAENRTVIPEKSKNQTQAERIRLLQNKVKETPSRLDSVFSSVKSIPKYVSNTLQAISGKAKKSTKDLSSKVGLVGKKLQQIPQNFTRVMQLWKNAISAGISNVGSKIQSIPNKVSEFGHNITNVNQTRLTEAKNLWIQRMKRIPEKISKMFSVMTNQVKKMTPQTLVNTTRISEGINKIKQRVNTTSVAKAINTFTNKLTAIPGKVTKVLTLGFQSVKQKVSESATKGIKFVKESSIGSFFSWIKSYTQGFLFSSVRFLIQAWSWISSLKTILYWILGAILVFVFLYFMAQALPIINFVIQIIKTPLDVVSLFVAILKSILPSRKQSLSKEEKEILEKFRKTKNPKQEKSLAKKKKVNNQYYSYYRCNACEKEWESPNTAENESQKCINDDCIKIIEPYHQIPLLHEAAKSEHPARQAFFSYYNCPNCQESWESPKAVKNEAQKCKNSECSQEVLPYHQIELLNFEQKRSFKIEKEKSSSKKH